MKLLFVALVSMIALSSCSSKSLSAPECTALNTKITEIMVSKLPSDSIDAARSKRHEYDQTFIASCTDGKTYDRDDYKCMMSATNEDQLTHCMISTALRKVGAKN